MDVKRSLKEFFEKDNDFNSLKEFHFSAVHSPLIIEVFFEKYKKNLTDDNFYLSKDLKELLILGLFYNKNYQSLLYLFNKEKDGIIRGKILDLLIELLSFEEDKQEKIEKLLRILQDVIFSETHSLFLRKKSIKAYAKLLSSDRGKVNEFVECILNELDKNKCFGNSYKIRYLSINLDVLSNIDIKSSKNNLEKNLKEKLKNVILTEDYNGLLKYKAFSCITHLFSDDTAFIKEILEELKGKDIRKYPTLLDKVIEFLFDFNKDEDEIKNIIEEFQKNYKEYFDSYSKKSNLKSKKNNKNINRNLSDSEIVKYLFINKLKKITFNNELVTEDFDSFHRELKEHLILLKKFKLGIEDYLKYDDNICVIYNLLCKNKSNQNNQS